jgi:integrase
MASGHLRQRGSGSWELKYDAGVDTVTRKRITKFATVRGSKRDAQRELRRLVEAVETGMHADPGKLTVGEWLERWLAEAAQSVAGRTHARYKDITEHHLIPALGQLPLARLAPIHIQDALTAALASGRRVQRKGSKRPAGLSAQTVLHHHRVLYTALERARALRLIARNPAEDVKPPKPEKPEIEVLDRDDIAKLLNTARDARLYPIVALALGTGLRRGEILGLRWSDLDLERRTLTVAQSLEQVGKELAFKPPKTRRSRRTIALSPSVVEMLKAHKAEQAAARLALGMGRDPAALVFTRIDGDPLQPDSVSKMFAKLVAKAGVRRVTFHALRHTHATELLRAGVHPKIASERLGHATVAITLDTYSHVLPGLQEEAAERIEMALRPMLAGA